MQLVFVLLAGALASVEAYGRGGLVHRTLRVRALRTTLSATEEVVAEDAAAEDVEQESTSDTIFTLKPRDDGWNDVRQALREREPAYQDLKRVINESPAVEVSKTTLRWAKVIGAELVELSGAAELPALELPALELPTLGEAGNPEARRLAREAKARRAAEAREAKALEAKQAREAKVLEAAKERAAAEAAERKAAKAVEEAERKAARKAAISGAPATAFTVTFLGGSLFVLPLALLIAAFADPGTKSALLSLLDAGAATSGAVADAVSTATEAAATIAAAPDATTAVAAAADAVVSN